MQNSFYEVIIPLVAGYGLDWVLGDPRKLPHPVVLFGNTIAFAEKTLNKGKCRKGKGALVALGLPLLTAGIFGGIMGGLKNGGIGWYCFAATIFVFYGLANRSLIREGREVIDTLEKQGLEAGRRRLSW